MKMVAWVPIHRSFDVDYFLLGISGEVNKLPKVTFGGVGKVSGLVYRLGITGFCCFSSQAIGNLLNLHV